jgi:hypothetical protein
MLAQETALPQSPVSQYQQSSFQSSGPPLQLSYGDSFIITKDTVNLAGLSLNNQYFAAVDQTNTSVLHSRATGIFGVGFSQNRSNVFVSSDFRGLPGRN